MEDKKFINKLESLFHQHSYHNSNDDADRDKYDKDLKNSSNRLNSDDEGSDIEQSSASKYKDLENGFPRDKSNSDVLYNNDKDRLSSFINPLRRVKKMKNVFYVRIKYIRHGYRAHRSLSACNCTASLFMLHNETFNVWTHLAGGIYFMYQVYLVLQNEGVYQDLKESFNKAVLLAGLFSCIFSMMSSAIYHLYNSISRNVYLTLLKIDLMGIGIMIFGLAICLIFTGFHNYSNIGGSLTYLMIFLMLFNFVMQCTPCYMQDSFEKFRILFFSVLVTLLLGVALSWAAIYSTQIEIQMMFWRLMQAFGYLGAGFFFYITKYPERLTSNYYVQMFGQAHIWWHILVFLNGYTNYWLLFDSLKHLENYPNGSELQIIEQGLL
ncbi:progestin and adipoq receptor family member 3-like [Stylonychia lemnae]|uniref:Progestin and adipoq receptor family member 3-like n=1 Tax=Stylonychia lemnae TaxID=5949 RepID=A0A078AM94_STYLE|nr:progestin and adipoq receptor family member 3-like [Stylonychia lemnae]|eukprot:CDW83515.1 progestin and adipoq receptor family member 3-like [Stylonychia lemnae]